MQLDTRAREHARTHANTSSKLYLCEDSHRHKAFPRSLPQLEPSQNGNMIMSLSSANTLTAISVHKIMIRAKYALMINELSIYKYDRINAVKID